MILPRKLLSTLLVRLPDRPFLHLLYFKYQRRFLRLHNPIRYTEFIQWLKLHGDLEQFTKYADKYAVRSYVAQKIGNEHLIPLLGVYDNFDEIPFKKLPKQFVLKGTHGYECNVVCKDKTQLDILATRQKFTDWLNQNYYKLERERQYKHIPPRIVCEQYLEDETGSLRDYKFFCVQGKPKLVSVDTNRFVDHKSELFETNWTPSDVQPSAFGQLAEPTAKPKLLKEMLEIARKLSADFTFVRVDLYVAHDRIYFGELTFTPGSGLITFDPATNNDQNLAKKLGLTKALFATKNAS